MEKARANEPFLFSFVENLNDMFRFLVFFLLIIINFSCKDSAELSDTYKPQKNALFKRLPSDSTNISFVNRVEEDQDGFDVFRYRNFYNGGGVGIADFNNDGLADVYITSNMGDNKLFLNKGNWKFQDITETAGVKGTKVWSTGVSIADINADGFLDIYVCNAGDVKGGKRENELFINNGDLTFSERAKEYGLADEGFTTHAAFFDYDKDGDLDCYVLNNSYRPISSLGYRNLRNERDPLGGHKLYRNDDGKFIDVSEGAGIYGSVIGFGLGVIVSDVNGDMWPDLYVSNDFYEYDYLYINNKKGGFDEKIQDHFGHISMFSMGADVADLNNDGFPEIFSTDMLPEDDHRLKTLIAFETYEVYQLRLRNGYYHQFMRNMLQANNGDGTFTEIGQLAGVAASDWSWGALAADFDNDGYKEIFVCNGITKDLINQDFVDYIGSSEEIQTALKDKKVDFKKFVNAMPSNKLSNYMFVREGEWQYKNKSREWGLDEPSFSNGSAYGDLDNDGDLDLIVNNVNQELFVYKNLINETKKSNHLTFELRGKGKNYFALGAVIKGYSGKAVFSFDYMPIRGFQSSMDYKLVMGLGNIKTLDSLEVIWPDHSRTVLKNVAANQNLILKNEDAKLKNFNVLNAKPLLEHIKSDSILHKENEFNDFDRNRLQYHMLSTQGPAFAKSDLNRDGLDDIFIGNGIGFSNEIWLQKNNNRFEKVAIDAFEFDNNSEDVDAIFFDADNDKDDDLFVVTGGSETSIQSTESLDRFYENIGLKNGKPVFANRSKKIPQIYLNGSCVRQADIDDDGDLDLFVGTRVNPQYYGIPCDQTLLINDGSGNFTDQTAKLAPQLLKLGMVTDAAWFNYNNDNYPDLLLVGEWMPITLFVNDGKQLVRVDSIKSFEISHGWWNRIKKGDIDGDGDEDFVLGNFGVNSKFQPTAESPIKLYVNDFDQNGSMDPIFSYIRNGKELPMALRQDLIKQMSSFKKKFVFYKDYAGKSLDQIFDSNSLSKATKQSYNYPYTSVLLNKGSAGFELKALPLAAQFAPVYGIDLVDVNSDSKPDLILGGNLFAVKPEVGRYDGLSGMVLLNEGLGNFESINSIQSGLGFTGETRHISVIRTNQGTSIAFVRNSDSVIFFKVRK